MTVRLKAVEDCRVGDLVRFTPGTERLPDQVTKVHLRRSSFLGPMVTISHPSGCWSKEVGESVEVVGRGGDG